MERTERKVIKVALIGSLSVGKSTLWRSLRKSYGENPQLGFVPEAARDFFRRNPQYLEDRFSIATQRRIQNLVYSREQRALLKDPRVIICDRSILDACVYVRADGNKEGANELFERISFWLPTYHTLYLLDPTNVPFKQDRIRTEDATTRERIHLTYLDFLSENRIPFTLLSGSLQERISQVHEFITPYVSI